MIEEPKQIFDYENYVILEYEYIRGDEYYEEESRYDLIDTFGPYKGYSVKDVLIRLNKFIEYGHHYRVHQLKEV